MKKEDLSRNAVIKIGGDVLLTAKGLEGLAQNTCNLIDDGWSLAVLHGGGPQISRLQQLYGLYPRKVGGRRITSSEDLLVVFQAVCGEANVLLTSAFIKAGIEAFGWHGASGRLIRARKRPPRVVFGGGNEPIDFGEVGDVSGINAGLLNTLLNLGLVPVIATLGVDDGGRVFNINADTTVVQIASALQAELLILTTKIGGIYREPDDPATRIKSLHVDEVPKLIKSEVIRDGMIPKLEEAVKGLRAGIQKVVIVGADVPDTFRSAAAGSHRYGTCIYL